MARAPLTNSEVDRILKAEKAVGQDVRWEIDPDKRPWAKCELIVTSELGLNLKLYLNWNVEEPSIFSYSLVLNNAYRIAGLDFNGSHRNKHMDRDVWQVRTHKHRWTEKCRNSWAYTPKDIATGDPSEVFNLFCKECNISFSGSFFSLPPVQQEFT